jgi:8-oxo-dGTP pyrophosphatase MutT (NUDIX family)
MWAAWWMNWSAASNGGSLNAYDQRPYRLVAQTPLYGDTHSCYGEELRQMARADLFQLGVKAVIQREDGRVLLIREPGVPHWDFPGGRLERGEPALDALRRELREEIGLAGQFTATFLTATVSKVRIPMGQADVGLILFAYTVAVPHEIHPDEATEVAWVDVPSLSQRLSGKYPPDFLATVATACGARQG